MSMQALGETFDIHTGGEDLVFPHHEDEIAQSEGATGRPFVHYWLHVKHLLVNGEKMSKSKRNDYTIAQLVDLGHPRSAIRWLLLSAQYRKELNFSFEGLDAARTSLQRLLDFERRLADRTTRADAPLSALPRIARDMLHDFEVALDDDLNTPAALAALFNFVREANAELDRDQPLDQASLQAARDALCGVDEVLGVIGMARAESKAVDAELAGWVELKIEERRLARDHRDFATADRIRDELKERGVVLEDTPQGVRWRRA
jgi:cysteinyl-tRNA synthetase